MTLEPEGPAQDAKGVGRIMSLELGRDAEGLKRILESIPEFVLVVDRDGLIRYINRMEPGFNHDEVIGMEAEAALLPGSREAFRGAFESVLADGETVEFEAELPLPDGTVAWYRSHMSPYQSGEGIRGVVLVAENLTELRRAQESAEMLRKLLPICSWCDRIQSEAGSWESIEEYVGRKEAARVSHGLCEDCHRKQIQGLDDPHEPEARGA